MHAAIIPAAPLLPAATQNKGTLSQGFWAGELFSVISVMPLMYLF